MPTSDLTHHFHVEHARLMGFAALLNDQNDQAHDWFARFAQLTPTAEAYYHDAIALLRGRYIEDAEMLFNRVTRMSCEPWTERAELALAKIHSEPDSIIPRYPAMFAHAIEELNARYFRRKDFLGAKTMLEAFVEDNGETPLLLSLTAQAYYNLQQPENAYSLASRAVKLNGDSLHAFYVATITTIRVGKVDQAISHARKAMSKWPQAALAAAAMASALLANNQRSEAEAVVNEALLTHPNHASLQHLLRRCQKT